MDPATAPARLRALPSWLLGQTALLSQRIGNERLSALGANRHHVALLSALDELERASQAELGRRLGIDPGDMVRLVGALQKEGWLQRAPDPEHRRRNVVTITPAGRSRLRQLDQATAQIQEDFLAPLSADDRKTLVRLLTRVLEGRHNADPQVTDRTE
jgi:DNA-binding MarR family transcriptional regulator